MTVHHVGSRLLFLAPALLLLLGCGKSDISGLVGKVKQTATDGTQRVKQAVSGKVNEAAGDMQEALKLAGKIELQLGAPITTEACYASLIAPGNGRTNVFQLQSYRSPDKETFPSVFLQAHVQASAPGELIGKVVSARLFVQPQKDGPVWFASSAGPVELKIMSIEEGMVDAELVGGSLASTAGGEVDVTGSFRGVVNAVGY